MPPQPLTREQLADLDDAVVWATITGWRGNTWRGPVAVADGCDVRRADGGLVDGCRWYGLTAVTDAYPIADPTPKATP